MQYKLAPEIKRQIRVLIKELNFTHIKPNQIWCIRSFDAKTRAYARIWGMSRLFKEVAGVGEKNWQGRKELNPHLGFWRAIFCR